MIKTKISATPSISVKHVICITLILYFAVSIAQFFMLNHNNALLEIGHDKRQLFIKLYVFMFIGFALYSLYGYVFINVMRMFHQWINVSRICLRIRNQFPNYIAAISELIFILIPMAIGILNLLSKFKKK